jgi:hypothetical protein
MPEVFRLKPYNQIGYVIERMSNEKVCIFFNGNFEFGRNDGLHRQNRPQLSDCGELLPRETHYSIELHADWNARTNPTPGQISITLTDEISGDEPLEIPESAALLMACVKASVGV